MPKNTPPKKGKAKAKRPASKKKGRPMIKLLFVALLAGAGYVAFAVPYQGRTFASRVAERANTWIESDSDDHPAHPARHPAEHGTKQADRSGSVHETHHAPASKPTEEISRQDREALDRLIPH